MTQMICAYVFKPFGQKNDKKKVNPLKKSQSPRTISLCVLARKEKKNLTKD